MLQIFLHVVLRPGGSKVYIYENNLARLELTITDEYNTGGEMHSGDFVFRYKSETYTGKFKITKSQYSYTSFNSFAMFKDQNICPGYSIMGNTGKMDEESIEDISEIYDFEFITRMKTKYIEVQGKSMPVGVETISDKLETLYRK